MRKLQVNHRIDTIFVLLVFCGFAASVLMVLLLGVQSYQEVAQKSQTAYDQRIAISYISAKVRHGDMSGGLEVGGFSDAHPDISTLSLVEEYDGVEYATRIYLHDGWVRELFCERGLAFNPEDGEAILQAEQLLFEVENDSLLRIICVDESGSEKSMLVHVRSVSGIA